MQTITSEAQRNAHTIEQIPATNITPVERECYLMRAQAGIDVYAYYKPASDLWDIWDTDTRIVMPLLSKRWQIVHMAQVEGIRWRVEVKRGTETHVIALNILQSITDHSGGDYQERAQRVILSIINHAAHFDLDIARLDITQH